MIDANWIADIVFEVTRAGVMLALVGYLWWKAAQRRFYHLVGWRLLSLGFTLVAAASVLDITDNFASLSRYIVVGDTVTEAFIEKELGYLMGFILIFAGYSRWLPRIERHTKDLEKEIERRKRSEKKREELQSQLVHSQKMEAVGFLAGGVAHDFNNVLTVISGQTGLLWLDLSPLPEAAEAVRHHVDQLQKSVARGAAITRQLLMFCRQDVTELIVLSPGKLLFDLEPMLRSLIGDDVELEFVVDPSVRCVRVDRNQLEQVVVNLVINSVHAMSDGGRITLEASNVASGESSFVQLTVTDTGSGMDAATLEQAFEPCFTTKEPGRGAGLGLSTVRSIVESIDGQVVAESIIGRGTTMSVRLPSVEESPTQQYTAPTPLVRRGSGTILVCEDDKDLRATVLEVLSGAGYSVLDCANGPRALSLAKEFPGEIRLLLTDLVMPGGMNGRQLVEALQLRRPDLPAVFMTGYGGRALGQYDIVGDSVRVLQKPFGDKELLRSVWDAVDGSD